MPARTLATKPNKKAKMAPPSDDLIMTLESDEEPLLDAESQDGESEEEEEEEDAEELPLGKGKGKARAGLAGREKIREDSKPANGKGKERAAEKKSDLPIDKGFEFDLEGDGWNNALDNAQMWDMSVKGMKGLAREGDPPKLTVDDIIERRKKARPESTVRLPSPDDDLDEDDDAAISEGSSLGGEALDDDAADGSEPSEDEDEFGAGARKRKVEALSEEEENDDEADEASSDEEEDEEVSQNEESSEDDEASSDEETELEKAKKTAYFAAEEDSKGSKDALEPAASFQSLNLSRALLRALASLQFSIPTPIQSRTIPIALAGKDLVAGAVTGSGKTAAFMIPILERLVHRSKAKDNAKSRVVVLTPTRELAIQCAGVGRALSKFTDIRFCLCVGGLSVKAQEAELKLSPDVIIATPGRLIDHVRNSMAFSLDDIEILVMDEADRMLEDGFADELDEIIRACPKGRQTMLFSATMTDSVEQLVRLSLRRPVRLFVDPKRTTAKKLTQEFVRVRGTATAEPVEGEAAPSKPAKRTEDEVRPALLLSLCSRTFRNGVIIFVRSKALAHQLRVLFGLVGLSATELHGDLSQEQRLEALHLFRDSKVDFMIATDLASRGLDIKGVQTVINYDMPAQYEQYIHRVGRTARAGRNGRAVTLVGEADRRLLKAVLKRTPSSQVRHRLIPTDVVATISRQVAELKDEIDAVLAEEKEEKAMRVAEMQLKKGENMVEHEAEIFSRPKRTWFQTEKEKNAAKDVSKSEYAAKVDPKKAASLRNGKDEKDSKAPVRDKYAGLSRKKRRSRQMRDEEAAEGNWDSANALAASLRSAKRSLKPTELGVLDPIQRGKSKDKKGGNKKKSKSGGEGGKVRSSTGDKKAGRKKGSAFAKDLGERGGGTAKSKSSGGSGAKAGGAKAGGAKQKGKGKSAGAKGGRR